MINLLPDLFQLRTSCNALRCLSAGGDKQHAIRYYEPALETILSNTYHGSFSHTADAMPVDPLNPRTSEALA